MNRSSARGGLLLLVVLWLLAPAEAWTTSWIAPARPLTDEELLENSVVEADAIALGTLVNIVGSSAYVEITHQLQGSLKPEHVEVGIWDEDWPLSEVLSWLRDGPADVMVFLRKVKPSKSDSRSWVFLSSPFNYRNGIVRAPPPERIWAPVEIVRKRLSIDSLAARADLVVLGSTGSQGRGCRPYGHSTPCLALRVERVLKGSVHQPEILAYSLVVGDLNPRWRGLFFLKAMQGAYETIGFSRGALAVQGNRVIPLGLSLEEVTRRIRLQAVK